ncbi:MAG: tRNA (cytidine(34)-2'-O)-methyltransferase [Clostridiales bacterium]|jgi:tRNA (cytidine/uridine-2'-O-)-methyltransferase|nr:tRNA (cytidine(34)-2'-O)-methyltransferase [Clostridiales bacterium]
MNIVLLEPEIPLNTGNIGRTCVAANTRLHLIEPLGFLVDDKSIKRSGLDYWDDLDVSIYKNYQSFLELNNYPKIIMATTKAKKAYPEIEYPKGGYILFGKESKGIPESLLATNYDNCVRIPMFNEYRSLNLSNSVAIILYEALRQQNFEGLELFGSLHNNNT